MTNDRIQRIRAATSLVDMLLSHGVKLKKSGNGYLACCIDHDDKNPSMTIYVKDGVERCNCHACGYNEDVIGAYMTLTGVGFKESLDDLDGGERKGSIEKPEKVIDLPPPASVSWRSEKPPSGSRPKSMAIGGMEPSQSWEYRDADGDLIGIIARYVDSEGKKTYRPWTYGRMGSATLGWQPRTWTPKRPLYGLDNLSKNHDAKIILVEGEKTADAAQLLIPQMVAVTWPGGAGGIHAVDWLPLANRDIVLIPDADAPGEQAMLTIASYLLPLKCKLRFVDTSGQPSGWDLADATGWTTQQAIEWARDNMRSIDSKELEAARLEAEKKTLCEEDEQDMSTATAAINQEQPAKRHTAVTVNEFMPPDFSELALAEHWLRSCGAEWVYTPAWNQWARWTGKRWEIDQRNSVTAITCDEMAMASHWSKSQNLNASQKRALCSKKNIANVLSLASAKCAVLPEEWDADHWLLGTPDGIVDLRTGKIRPATKEDRITKQTAVSPMRGAHPVWDSVLKRCTGGDDSMLQYYQRWVGYTLTGSCKEEAFLFVHGKGGAGKSKFIDCIGDMLGDYCATAKIETLMESKFERHTEEIAALYGARMVRASEPEEGARWNEALLKLLTGRDTVSARRLYEKQFSFKPQFKLWINGNFRPALKSTGEEISRRMHFVNFPDPIPADERVHNLPELLQAEWPAILQWAIDGCLAWQDVGLGKPDIVEDATRDYLDDEDTLGRWIAECCAIGSDYRVQSGEAYQSYKKYVEAAGEGVVSQKRFSSRLEARGFGKIRSGGIRYISGIAVTGKVGGIGF